MIYPERWCLFHTAKSYQGIQEAKNYVKKYGLTPEDVKIISDDEEIMIITKRAVELKS